MKLTQSQLRHIIKEELDRRYDVATKEPTFEEAHALGIKELQAAELALDHAIVHISDSTGGGTYWSDALELRDQLQDLLGRFREEEPVPERYSS